MTMHDKTKVRRLAPKWVRQMVREARRNGDLSRQSLQLLRNRLYAYAYSWYYDDWGSRDGIVETLQGGGRAWCSAGVLDEAWSVASEPEDFLPYWELYWAAKKLSDWVWEKWPECYSDGTYDAVVDIASEEGCDIDDRGYAIYGVDEDE